MNPQFGLEKRLAYRFSVLSTLNVRFVSGLYTKKFGLSLAGWRVLSIIGRHEPIFPGVTAQLSTMDPDKVTRAVDRLVEMGYVVRNVDAADRRRVILCLASKGRAVYEEIEELSQDMDAKWRASLTKEENAMLDVLIDKLDARAHGLFAMDLVEPRASARAVGKRAAARASNAAPKVDRRKRAA